MAKIISITNGVGTSDVINGNYDVTSEVTGYENTSISPSNVQIVEGTNTYAFTIAATGTLTLHVSEDGTSEGVPVLGATFIRTDSDGNEYGDAITTDANGDAIFENVPYAETGAPLVYYKQTASDGNHEFDDTVQSTTLTSQSETLEITNALGAIRTINLTDANYSGLPVDGTLTLNEEA